MDKRNCKPFNSHCRCHCQKREDLKLEKEKREGLGKKKRNLVQDLFQSPREEWPHITKKDKHYFRGEQKKRKKRKKRKRMKRKRKNEKRGKNLISSHMRWACS